jgi:hypothetical protein
MSSDIKISEFPRLNVTPTTDSKIPIVQNNTNYSVSASNEATPQSLVYRNSEGGGVKFTSTTGDGNKENASVFGVALGGGCAVAGESVNGWGINGVSKTSSGVYGYSPNGIGTYGVSVDGVGMTASSSNGTGVEVNTNQGSYSAIFQYGSQNQLAVTGDRANLTWFYNGFTGTLKSPNLLSSNTWTLPRRSGEIVVSDTSDGVMTISGGVTLNGINSYASHAAADLAVPLGSLYRLSANRTVFQRTL